MALVSCSKDNAATPDATTLATVVTAQPTTTDSVQYQVGVTVTSTGTITEAGIAYDTLAAPTTASPRMAGTGTSPYTVALSSLKRGRTYFVSGYAINAKGTALGNAVTLTTKADRVRNLLTAHGWVIDSLLYQGTDATPPRGVCNGDDGVRFTATTAFYEEGPNVCNPSSATSGPYTLSNNDTRIVASFGTYTIKRLTANQLSLESPPLRYVFKTR